MVNEIETHIPITPVTRKLFSLDFKHYAVCYINNAMANKMANAIAACDYLCIPHFYYKRWKNGKRAEKEIGCRVDYWHIQEHLGQNR